MPFNLGSVDGQVSLTLDNKGIRGGSLSGKVCASGACSTLNNVGTVDFSSVTNPSFCVHSKELSLPGPDTRYCVSF